VGPTITRGSSGTPQTVPGCALLPGHGRDDARAPRVLQRGPAGDLPVLDATATSGPATPSSPLAEPTCRRGGGRASAPSRSSPVAPRRWFRHRGSTRPRRGRVSAGGCTGAW
jgi:hypothetical protein